MIKIDLITGFLGAGKTTFIEKYARWLMAQGQKIGILENDYGAVNVDRLLLQDLEGPQCDLEMIAGGCDADCHRRRFRTKLIAMGMLGYDRVLVEPSGIYDVDEFFDALCEAHTEDEISMLASAGAKIIGVNCRNLKNFETDFERVGTLIKLVPQECVKVSESAIGSRETLLRAGEYGADAALIGSELMRASSPADRLSQLLGKK